MIRAGLKLTVELLLFLLLMFRARLKSIRELLLLLLLLLLMLFPVVLGSLR